MDKADPVPSGKRKLRNNSGFRKIFPVSGRVRRGKPDAAQRMAKNSDHALSFVSSFKGKSEVHFSGHETGLDPFNARPPEALDCGGCSAALGTNDAAPQSWEESQHSKACGA